MIDRLIDNLPDSARQSQAFASLLISMGPDRVRAHLDELMSYGLFDWAITDAEATEVFRMITLLPAADQTTIVGGMTAQMRARFVDNLPGLVVIDQSQFDALRRFFDATPDAEVDTLMALLGLRFNIDVTTEDGGTWDKAVLTRSWDVLKMLPPAHVAANPDLERLLMYSSTSIEGYANSDGDAAMATGGQNVDTTNETGAFTNPGDPLFGVNMWDTTLRHEIGHRVDPQVNATDGYCKTAYAAYYDPSGGSKGALLTGRDDPTKAWFDSSVDPQGGAGSVDPTTQVG